MLLAIDPATRTGWALFADNVYQPVRYGFFDTPRGTGPVGEWLLRFAAQLRALMAELKPERVVVEDFSAHLAQQFIFLRQGRLHRNSK
jgi:Holliday junction resolvasome RuvABC endonuclease subunit